MDLSKNGKFLRALRIGMGMTQKELAEKIDVLPKTVSKWETGKGFPDVSTLPALADALGVSERVLLNGDLIKNAKEVGNPRRTKFYVCPCCGSFTQGTGKYQVVCCDKVVEPLTPQKEAKEHSITILEIENDFYIEFNHEMTKEHFISFVSYVAFDRVLTIRLYPEQDGTVRFPKMYGGKLYFYCNKHGLFVY